MNIETELIEKLVKSAMEASKNAYCIYSNFHVGAALLTTEGKIYTGVNVENASYGLGVCAERNAFFKAISEGERKFLAIAIYCDVDTFGNHNMSCGACRQVMAEFCKDDFTVIFSINGGKYEVSTLGEIFPKPFRLN